MRVSPPMRRLALLVPFLAAAPAAAQNLIMDHDLPRALWIELAVPSLTGASSDQVNWMVYSGFRIPVGRELTFVAELPVAFASAFSADVGTAELVVGNPWIAVRWKREDSHVDVGVRFPRLRSRGGGGGSSLARASAAYGDYDRYEAWARDLFALKATIAGRIGHDRDGMFGRLAAGPTILTGYGEYGGSAAVLIDYAGHVGYGSDALEAIVGLTGRYLPSQGGDPSEYGTNQLTAAVTLRGRILRPTIYMRIPISRQLKSVFKNTYGLALTVGL